MAGQFSKAQRPARPGGYFNFNAAAQAPTLLATQGVVAIPFLADWGPENAVRELFSLGDYIAAYGNNKTAGYKAVKQAFQGEGLPGRGGAVKVVAYRMTPTAGTPAVAATRTLQNTTPAVALTLTAKFKGTRANAFTVSTVDLGGGTHQFTLQGDQGAKETYTYTSTNIANLAVQINASSGLATAVSNITGTALAIVTTQAFAGGVDGVVASADLGNARTAFEAYRFSLVALSAAIADADHTNFKTWIQGLNTNGKRCMLVVGGAQGEAIGDTSTTGTAVHRSQTLYNDPHVVCLGVGTYTDSDLGTLGTAELAPRIAGILAQRGEQQSITFSRLAGLSIASGAPTQAQILTALSNGVVVISQDSHPQSPLRIEKGLTTWTLTSDPDRPVSIYSVPKFVRTMCGIEVEITDFLEQNVIGTIPVDQAGRDFVISKIRSIIGLRESNRIVQNGWTVSVDATPAPQATDDFIAVAYGLSFTRSMEQVLNTVTVG